MKFLENVKNKFTKLLELYEVTEEFTSKTCGSCGEIHYNLGSSKTFTCPKSECKFTIPRDWNGARNILLKNFQKSNLEVNIEKKAGCGNTAVCKLQPKEEDY